MRKFRGGRNCLIKQSKLLTLEGVRDSPDLMKDSAWLLTHQEGGYFTLLRRRTVKFFPLIGTPAPLLAHELGDFFGAMVAFYASGALKKFDMCGSNFAPQLLSEYASA